MWAIGLPMKSIHQDKFHQETFHQWFCPLKHGIGGFAMFSMSFNLGPGTQLKRSSWATRRMRWTNLVAHPLKNFPQLSCTCSQRTHLMWTPSGLCYSCQKLGISLVKQCTFVRSFSNRQRRQLWCQWTKSFALLSYAELTFEQLPTRLEHFFGRWDPALDSSRSVPHKWVFAVEIFFGASVLLAAGLMAFVLTKLVQNFCREDENQADDVATLLQVQLPKVCKLARHVDIQDEVCGNVTGALDACEEVKVLQVECSEGNVHGRMSTRVLNYLKSMVFATTFQSVWGRLESPPGPMKLCFLCSVWHLERGKPSIWDPVWGVTPIP